MRVGETLEVAIWLTGNETPEMRARFEADCKAALARLEVERRLVCGPVRWTEKGVLEDRVPTPPDHVQGPAVRLLVAEADIVAERPANAPLSRDLDDEPLARLRAIVRARHARARPFQARLTDAECDAIIDEVGPDAAATVVSGLH